MDGWMNRKVRKKRELLGSLALVSPSPSLLSFLSLSLSLSLSLAGGLREGAGAGPGVGGVRRGLDPRHRRVLHHQSAVR